LERKLEAGLRELIHELNNIHPEYESRITVRTQVKVKKQMMQMVKEGRFLSISDLIRSAILRELAWQYQDPCEGNECDTCNQDCEERPNKKEKTEKQGDKAW
jgi:Arc/MetJ-type ribon-helix-helix transcriptional regulator